jgi:hypothetical protein
MTASLTAHAPNPAWPASEVETLTRVSELLDRGKPDSALSLLPAGGTPWLRNARGVCLMRLGRPSQAVDALRELVFEPVGHAVRADAHPAHLMNYATALLLDGNSDSFWGIFRSARDRSHPAVVRVEASVWRWRARLSFTQRAMVALGGGPRLVLDIPPGEV